MSPLFFQQRKCPDWNKGSRKARDEGVNTSNCELVTRPTIDKEKERDVALVLVMGGREKSSMGEMDDGFCSKSGTEATGHGVCLIRAIPEWPYISD